MSAGEVPAAVPDAAAEISAQREQGFEHLEANGIKKSVLDDFEAFLTSPGTLSRKSLIVRCQVTNGDWKIRVVVDKQVSQPRLTDVFVPLTRRLQADWSGSADFFVLVSDNLYVSERRQRECIEYFKNVPFLRCDQSDDDRVSMHTILIPDYFVLDSQYADDLIAIERAARAHPFEQRIELVKWRGNLHGPQYANDENYAQFPRYRLALVSRERPDVVDARLTDYDVEESESGAALRRRLEAMFGSPAEVLPAAAFVAYKYRMSTDGVGAGWKRLPTSLASGSVVLMQHRWRQFFYAGLKPWVHYVPVRDDMSDLVDRYGWLTTHPSEAKSIAENGLRFARQILTPRALETYFLDVVARCGELYRPDA
jgi:hypothetical protein